MQMSERIKSLIWEGDILGMGLRDFWVFDLKFYDLVVPHVHDI